MTAIESNIGCVGVRACTLAPAPAGSVTRPATITAGGITLHRVVVATGRESVAVYADTCYASDFVRGVAAATVAARTTGATESRALRDEVLRGAPTCFGLGAW